MRLLAIRREGKCLSECYEKDIPLEWECKNSHRWTEIYSRSAYIRWCRVCAGVKTYRSRNKYDLTEARSAAAACGWKYLSDKYRGVGAETEWECPRGHVCLISFDDFSHGKRCKICSRGIYIMEEITREIFNRLFHEKFIKCNPTWLINPFTGYTLELDGYCKKLNLAFEYQGPTHFQNVYKNSCRTLEETKAIDNTKSKLCAENGVTLVHINYGYSKETLSKHIVDICIGRNISGMDLNANLDYKTFDIYSIDKFEEIKELIRSKEGECLSKKYYDTHTKLDLRCKYKHIWQMTPHDLKRGYWCPKCSTKKKFTMEFVQSMVNSFGIVCLTDKYDSTRAMMLFRCIKNHYWWTSFSTIVKRKRCPICNLLKYRKLNLPQ
jgi:hypothetical protein